VIENEQPDGVQPPHAADELLPAIYNELRRAAHSLFASRRPGDTLEPTALVNEAAMRFLRQESVSWGSPEQLFVGIATAMRRILIDRARRKASLKGGVGHQRVPLEADIADAIEVSVSDEVLLQLEDALEPLQRDAPRVYRVVVMRFFLGMSNEEIAQIERRSTKTVTRDWDFARTWIKSHMGEEAGVTHLDPQDRNTP
jgi:RNA polymerase sigma factor (TIGR02999 family)